LRDARKVSLDIGREHWNSRTRKSLSHHLQRYGFSSSGSTGDEAMAISKRERQPGLLLTLSNEIFSSVSANLPSDVAIASPLRAHQGSRRHDHTACCHLIETRERA